MVGLVGWFTDCFSLFVWVQEPEDAYQGETFALLDQCRRRVGSVYRYLPVIIGDAM
jgi:hypothetical protein